MAVTMNVKGTSHSSFKIGKNTTLNTTNVVNSVNLEYPNKSGTLATLDDIAGGGDGSMDGGFSGSVFISDQFIDGGSATN